MKEIKYRFVSGEEELFEIAKGIDSGQIFTSKHLDNEKLISTVFMVLTFASDKILKDLEEAYVCYEYNSNALKKLAVNGYPIFHSCKLLTADEWDRILEYIDKIEAAVNKVKPKGEPIKGEDINE